MSAYVKMTVKEAREIIGDDSIVLVSVQDLTKKETLVNFSKKKGRDCKNFIEEAKLIAKIECEIRVFSERQIDPFNFEPSGFLRTVLLKE